jgi:outer membrane protein OmpA-like peptidoglycan-associated protein
VQSLRVAVAAIAVLTLSGCDSFGGREITIAPPVQPSPKLDMLDMLDRSSREALERGIASGRLSENKVVYSVVLADDAARFDSGRFTLTPEVRQQLIALAQQIQSENETAYLEIQGHTDSVGSAARNRKLGLKRAETVRQFLSRQGVAADRMATVSYGEDAPVAPNADPVGRAENRRVVIVVLS